MVSYIVTILYMIFFQPFAKNTVRLAIVNEMSLFLLNLNHNQKFSAGAKYSTEFNSGKRKSGKLIYILKFLVPVYFV